MKKEEDLNQRIETNFKELFKKTYFEVKNKKFIKKEITTNGDFKFSCQKEYKTKTINYEFMLTENSIKGKFYQTMIKDTKYSITIDSQNTNGVISIQNDKDMSSQNIEKRIISIPESIRKYIIQHL